MIRYVKILPVLVAALFALSLMPSCSGPKVIPDRVLTEILKEVFITNAYIQSRGDVQPQRDSLDIYRPILASYNYTMKDLEHTLASFSKRKSVKFSDVIDRVVRELEAEESEFRYRASILDTLDARAQRAWTTDIIRDSSITATAIRDTSLLTVAVPVRKGIYEVSFFYEIDSTDANKQLKTTYTLSDAGGKSTVTPQTSWMSSRRRTRVNQTMMPQDRDSMLTIRFGNYPQDLKRPNMQIDSLSIVFKPLVPEALDSLDRVNLPYKRILDKWL